MAGTGGICNHGTRDEPPGAARAIPAWHSACRTTGQVTVRIIRNMTNQKRINKMKKILFACTMALISMAGTHTYAAPHIETPPAKPEDSNRPRLKCSGQVVDAESGEALAFANVQVLGTTLGAITDADGRFSIREIPTKSIRLRISYIGYRSTDFEVDMTKESQVFGLMPAQINMDEVVVSANRTETRRSQAPVLVNVTDQKLFTATNSVSLDEALKFNPGVRVEDNCQNCGFNQVRINGLEGTYSQIVINSRSIFSALAGVYGLEMLPTSMIDRIEVVRGGGSALYGSAAIGGTVNIITKTPVRNSASASYTMSGYRDNWDKPAHDASFYGTIVDDDARTGISVFGRMKSRKGLDFVRPGSQVKADPALGTKDGQDGYSEMPQLYSATVGTSLFYRMAPTTKLNFDYFYTEEARRGGDHLSLPEHEAHIAESLRHRMHTGVLRLDHWLMDGKGLFTAFVAGSNTHRDSYYGGGAFSPKEWIGKSPKDIEKEDIDGMVASLNAYGSTDDHTLQAGAQYVHNFDRLLFMPSELTVGVEYNHNSLTDKSGYRRENIAQRIGTTSGILQNEWKSDYFGILLGARYDHLDLTSGKDTSAEALRHLNILTPRMTLRYNPTEQLHFRASYAHGFRAPQFFDEELHVAFANGEGIESVLSKDLHEERSRSITLSGDYYFRIGSGWHVNLMAEGFYTRLLDKFNPELRDAGGKSYYEVVNSGNAKVYGANFEARLSYRTLLDLQLGFTAQRSLFDRPADTGLDGIEDRHFMRTPDTYGYFVGTWRPTDHFTFNLSGDYTGRMYVPHVAGDVEAPYITATKDELVHSKPFFTLGTKAAYDFHVENSIIEFSIGVNNLLDSYQRDFDEGPNRASDYIYGPKAPRSVFVGCKLTI